MRTPNVLLPLALLLAFHPASRASARTQTASHQHTIVARQYAIAYHPAAPSHHHFLALGTTAALPETINPPARATVFSYLVNLIRGLFSRAF